MKKMKSIFAVTQMAIMLMALMIIGCASSDESSKESMPPAKPAEPSATEMMQKEMGALKSENESLKGQVAKLEQDNRAATARAAELETQLSEIKDKLTETPPPAMKHTSTSTARGTYDDAIGLFRARKYDDAASILQGLVDGGNAGDMESNCHYWLGECSYATKNYKEAIGHLQKVFGYEKTSKKDDAQLMIANCYFAMGDKARAKTEYQKLIDKYPASPYVKRARGRLEQM